MKFLRDLFGGREERRHDQVDEDAPAVVAAMEEARRTLPAFWRAYEDSDLRASCMLKLRLTGEGGREESIWVSDITRNPDGVRGLLADQPASLAPLVYCSEVAIESDQISDWRYVKDDKVWGAFTDRAIILNLSEAGATELPPMFSPTPVEGEW